jgi:hypothetical protein
METEIVDVRHNGEIVTLRVPKGMPDAEIQSYLQKNSGQPAAPRPTSALGAVDAFATNLSNSLLFGAPEYINRAINPGAGAMYDQMREDYPKASTAGDVVGMINPARLGYKAATSAINAVGRKVAPEAVESAGQKALQDAALKNVDTYTDASKRFDIAQARARVNPTPENLRAAEDAQRSINTIAKDLANVEKAAQKNAAGSVVGKTARVGAQTAGGIMGLQAGAGLVGEARTPGDFGPGFQQGSQTAGQMVREYNPLQFIPGVPQVTQGVTSVVPGAVGYGSLAIDALRQPQAPVAPTDFDMDRRIREEAYRRSMGLQ